MANTTNFGWETPDDTDLVKDGALAMRTLGNAIDTSFLDLKGGTSGQNLRKNSNTDLDFVWAGDATNTVIDAEGDLLVGDSADTLQRLAIGTTGQVLTVDTAVDGKIKWAAAGGGISGWTSFTPTWTNLTVGNGTVVAAYRDNGDMIDCQIKLTWGSTTSISGSVNIALPVTGHSSIVELILPCGQLHDSGSYYFIGALWFFNASTVRLFRLDCNTLTDLQGANVSATAPASWTTNDIFNFSFSYRKA